MRFVRVVTMMVALSAANLIESLNFNDTSVDVSTTNKKAAEFIATEENPFKDDDGDGDGDGKRNESQFPWANEAIQDIAHYLRAHKFNEYDRRYADAGTANASKDYFRAFPRPPLRSLHWEVHKHCEPSFLGCISYLASIVKQVMLQRIDDTNVAVQVNRWNMQNNSAEIETVDADCRRMRDHDEISADPFQGPIERFQWRVTASYYMCWYTLNRTSHLQRFRERCDNFANCLDPDYPPSSTMNGDPRAQDDRTEFGCALYSFCPDPCCPLKHVSNWTQCWDSPANPCVDENVPERGRCLFPFEDNVKDFRDMILNRWNVSCECTKRNGRYVWSSAYGTCVDVDECETGEHDCDSKKRGEACINTPGSYLCVCRWGYFWSEAEKRCVASPALSIIKLDDVRGDERTGSEWNEKKQNGRNKEKSIVRLLYHGIAGALHSSSRSCTWHGPLFTAALCVLVL